jgi:uncharacterized protein YdhG (YjbR/CyaY superfamily)
MELQTTVDAYIASFPEEVQQAMQEIRSLIQQTAPEVVESISYAMPAYKYQNKPLVYFAGYAHHIGFYATPNGHEAFKEELSKYKGGKGSVQFPLNKKMPLALIKRIVKFRMNSIQEQKKK